MDWDFPGKVQVSRDTHDTNPVAESTGEDFG